MTKQNTINLKDVYLVKDLINLPEFSNYKIYDLVSYLQRKGATKLILTQGAFNGAICFRRSEIDNLLDEIK